MNVRYMDDKELTEVHKIHLIMLEEIDRICRKNNIKYIISGGTMLGAIRHKGFIPWDDDVDICMDRNQYDRFCEICQKELDLDRFFFQTYKTDKAYPWLYGKLRYNYSRFIREGQEHLKMNTGIFIDIFPADGIPNNFLKKKLTILYCYILKKHIYSIVGKKSEKNFFKRKIYLLMDKVPKKILYKKIEKLSKKYSNERYKDIIYYAMPPSIFRNDYSKREWLYDLIEVEFEGKNFFTTKYYHQWLSKSHEDYMQLPPEEERIGHNTIVELVISKENIQFR